MIDRQVIKCDTRRSRIGYLLIILLLNIAGVLYYAYYLLENGYLPSPFIYDKSDTFMDFFNVLYWAYDDGRYIEWGSVYPPLNFIILRVFNFLLTGEGYGDPAIMRENSKFVIIAWCLAYLTIPGIILQTQCWKSFSRNEKYICYIAISLSTPMLFTLERGNLILIAPVILAISLSKIGLTRSTCIAILINLKPYFILLMLYYVARRNLRGLAVCIALSGLLFIITGLVLDQNFMMFLVNILNFSQEESIFSLREVLALPSSISSFSYVLKNPDGANYLSDFIGQQRLAVIFYIIEIIKLGALAISFAVLFLKSKLMRDSEIISLLIVSISNFGVSVGGYTFILYIALIPVLAMMKNGRIYVGILSVLAIPLDIVQLAGGYIGEQYSYFDSSSIDIYWTLGLGSLLRPTFNLGLLIFLSSEIFARVKRLKNAVNTGPL